MYYPLFRCGLFLCCLGLCTLLNAQDNPPEWSLERCIQYAVENSLQVQQANLAKAQALLIERQAIWTQAPTVNGNIRSGVNAGRSVDITTNEFTLRPIVFTSASIKANWIAYQGMQIRNTIKQSRIDVGAAEQDNVQAETM